MSFYILYVPDVQSHVSCMYKFFQKTRKLALLTSHCDTAVTISAFRLIDMGYFGLLSQTLLVDKLTLSMSGFKIQELRITHYNIIHLFLMSHFFMFIHKPVRQAHMVLLHLFSIPSSHCVKEDSIIC